MRREGLLALVAVAACSGGDSDGTFEFGPFDVAAQQEITTKCVQITLHNSEAMFVNTVELTTGPGFHHSNWFFVPEHVFAGPDGTFECNDRDFDIAAAAAVGGVFFAQSTQSAHEVQAFPAGMAIPLNPKTKLIAQIHLLNRSDEDLVIKPNIKITTIPEAEVTTRLAGISMEFHPLSLPPRKQSRFTVDCDLEPYRDAMRALASRALVYPSALTRAEIEAAASAPQEGAHDTPFPPHLRPALSPLPFDADAESTNWRFASPAAPVAFTDALAGPQSISVADSVGDFVVWTKRGQPAYQLAVVVDDHRQRITQVVRGDDLLDSAARQLLLFRALNLGPEPAYTHLPLVRGEDGRRLAKRHGDTRIDYYRSQGVPPEAVIGLIASWSIPGAPREPISAAEFSGRFDLVRMPTEPVTFHPEDDQWLRSFA